MLARRTSRIKPSGIRRIFELMASMEDPINFSIGQAHYDPPEELIEAACRAMREGHNRYTVTQGLPGLNEKVVGSLKDRWGQVPDHSIITSGVSGGLMLSYLALLDPGDEILLPDPHFTMYSVLATLCDAECRFYSTYPEADGGRFRLDPEELAAKVTDRTKIILINSPSNPTGGLLTQDEVDAAVRIASDAGAYLLSDEIYDGFVYDEGYASPLASGYDRVIHLGGFSKTYGVPGWRMGYALGPQDVLDQMKTMQQFSFVCAPAPFQHAIADVAFDLDLSHHVTEYRTKRDALAAQLDSAYHLTPPGGAFYAFPRYPVEDGESFMNAALEEKLLVVPGKAFSERDTHFRLSFAVSDADLDRGIDALNRIAARLR